VLILLAANLTFSSTTSSIVGLRGFSHRPSKAFN